MPVMDGKNEMATVYDYFCDVFEANRPLMLGEKSANLPHILSALLVALFRGVFDGEDDAWKAVKARMPDIFRSLRVCKFSEGKGCF